MAIDRCLDGRHRAVELVLQLGHLYRVRAVRLVGQRPQRSQRLVLVILEVGDAARVLQEVEDVAQRLINRSVNHIVVVDDLGKLKGIVTSWDITKAVAKGKSVLRDIIVRRVYTATLNEPLELASRRMAQHNISALPVVDGGGKVVGIVTSEDISGFLGGRRLG